MPLYAVGIVLLEYMLVPLGIFARVQHLFDLGAVIIVWLIADFADSYSFRFGLRSLLAATAIVAVVCFLAVKYVRPYM